jgi:hypothetical protein
MRDLAYSGALGWPVVTISSPAVTWLRAGATVEPGPLSFGWPDLPYPYERSPA